MNKLQRFLNIRAARNISSKILSGDLINKIIARSKFNIPVIIVSFNNGTYVKNMVQQLYQREIVPLVIDNNSSDPDTIKVLEEIALGKAEVVRSKRNLGHLVGFLDPVYKILPDVFAYTDPDLQFSPELPDNFLLELSGLTDQYKCFKAGMALDISNFGEMKKLQSSTTRKYPFYFHKIHDVLDWEAHFWMMPLKHDRLEIYAAPIDTTFAVYQKKYFHSGDFSKGVRVAGKFSACHLPWFAQFDIISNAERKNYIATKDANAGSWVK